MALPSKQRSSRRRSRRLLPPQREQEFPSLVHQRLLLERLAWSSARRKLRAGSSGRSWAATWPCTSNPLGRILPGVLPRVGRLFPPRTTTEQGVTIKTEAYIKRDLFYKLSKCLGNFRPQSFLHQTFVVVEHGELRFKQISNYFPDQSHYQTEILQRPLPLRHIFLPLRVVFGRRPT